MRPVLHSVIGFSALLLLLVACSSTAPESEEASLVDVTPQDAREAPTPSAVARSAAERHALQEDAIAACMTRRGFVYERRPYVEYWASSHAVADAGIFLSAADERGYGGVFLGLVQNSTAVGAAEPDLGTAERNAYYRALAGAGLDHPHAATEEEHDHEDGSHTHDADADIGGCFAEGEFVKRSAAAESSDEDALLSEQLAEDFFDRVYGSAQFSEFERGWSTCMASTGIDTRGLSPQVFSAQSQLEIAGSAIRILQEGAIGGERLSAARYDTDWLETVAASNTALQALLDTERESAVVDKECRLANQELLNDEIRRISLEMGLPD